MSGNPQLFLSSALNTHTRHLDASIFRLDTLGNQLDCASRTQLDGGARAQKCSSRDLDITGAALSCSGNSHPPVLASPDDKDRDHGVPRRSPDPVDSEWRAEEPQKRPVQPGELDGGGSELHAPVGQLDRSGARPTRKARRGQVGESGGDSGRMPHDTRR